MDGVAEDEVPGREAEHHRHREGVEPENEAAPAVAPEIVHVHLQTRQEHDVQKTRRARKNDAAVAQHQVEPVGADDRTGDDEPQQVGYLQPVEQQRGPQYDGHDKHELEDGVLQRQGKVDGCE